MTKLKLALIILILCFFSNLQAAPNISARSAILIDHDVH